MTSRKPGELLLRTTLKDYKKLWLLIRKRRVDQSFCRVLDIQDKLHILCGYYKPFTSSMNSSVSLKV